MKNVLNCILLIIVAIIFFGCGGRTFGFDECEDNSECPINYICGQENRCIPFHQSSSSIIGDSDTTTDSETGTNQGTDSDSQTDTHTETDSESDSESDTSIDTAPICPYYCLDTLECIYIDGIFHLEFNCGSANSICCEPFVDTETGSDSETDSDSDSQSDSESDTDSATETDSNSDCPFDCMFYITCDSLGGVEESEYSCDGASNVCCNLTIDSDTQTDSETDSQSDGDCPFLCVSAWACGQSYSGTIAWDYSCDSFPNICCEPGTVIDTDSDSETDSTTDSDTHTDSDSATDSDTHTDSDSATDSDTHTDSDSESESDTTGCTGTPPSCLQDYSGLYNSAGCCAAISVAALCPGGVWECPPGYLIDDACQNFAPDCPILPPEGCGFEYPIFYPAGNNISSVAAGYFNDDSNLDVVAAAIFDNGFTVLTGNGDGTFNPTTTYVNVGETPSSIKVLDLNDDGYSDVAMTFRDDNNIGLFLGNGDTTFNTKIAIPTYTDPYDLAIADINNDNVNDFIVTSNSYDTPRVVVRLAEVSDGIWNGSFQNIKSTITGLGPTGLATGDFNEDGNVDVAVACGLENSIDVLFGRGDGYFNNDLSLISGNNPMLVTVTDLDGDDNDDILVGNQFSDTISIWFGNGDGTFGFREDYGTGNGSRAVEVALFNDDNVPDLIVSNWQDDSLSLLFGTGVSDLTFTGLDSFYSGDGPSRPIIYDFNNDGVPDAVLGSRGEDAIAVMIGYCEEE